MQSKYLHYIIFILIFHVSVLSGQQQYQASDYGGPGTIYLYNRITSIVPLELIKESGENVTWDMRLDSSLNTHPTRIVTPSQAIDQFTFLSICSFGGNSAFDCFSIWNNTDQAVLSQDSMALFGFSLNNLQRYQNKTSNKLLENFFGFTVDFGGLPTQGVIVYDEPDVILEFPVTYGDSWISPITWSIDLSATGQNIQYHSIQTRTSEVDAWGTIITPYDTFTNVVRVRSEIMHTDTLYTDTLDIPINITQVEYMWFDTSYKLPVMIANGIIADSIELINVVGYIYDATCPSPTWDLELAENVFYLDTSGSVTIDFEIINPNANEYAWDFGDGTFETTGGSVSHTFSSAGDYSVGVTGCMTNCLPLNSCMSDIVDFQILDTVSAIHVVPGADLGIKLYPNPVKDQLTIEMPPALANYSYAISDIAGRVLSNGTLNSSKTVLQNKLRPGSYVIRFTNPNSVYSTTALMRFMVVD